MKKITPSFPATPLSKLRPCQSPLPLFENLLKNRASYYKSFDDANFNENNINLISFESWLANKIYSSLNPIATLIESTIRFKGPGNQGDKSNKLKHDNKKPLFKCQQFSITVWETSCQR